MYLCRSLMYSVIAVPNDAHRASRVDLVIVATLETVSNISYGEFYSRAKFIISRRSGDKAWFHMNGSDDAVRTDSGRTTFEFEYNHCVADQQLDKVPILIECKVQVQSMYT